MFYRQVMKQHLLCQKGKSGRVKLVRFIDTRIAKMMGLRQKNNTAVQYGILSELAKIRNARLILAFLFDLIRSICIDGY